MAAAAAGPPSPSPPPPTCKLHNTSFTLTCLTPLYAFNPARLHHYARELRDIVRGDVLRGVQIASTTAQTGIVRSCEWTVESDVLPTEQFDAVQIKIAWEDGAVFTAFMIPDYTASEQVSLGKRKREREEFTSLPLLLTKGSQVVAQQLINYITTRFDSKASDVSLPAELLAECLQGYLERVFRDDANQRTIDRSLRILELIFSVPEPSNAKVKGALRKITFSLGARDVQEMYRRSPKMLESLSKHVRASTAISLSSVTLTRIACAGVIIDGSGKMKLFENAGIDGTKFILSRILAFVAK